MARAGRAWEQLNPSNELEFDKTMKRWLRYPKKG